MFAQKQTSKQFAIHAECLVQERIEEYAGKQFIDSGASGRKKKLRQVCTVATQMCPDQAHAQVAKTRLRKSTTQLRMEYLALFCGEPLCNAVSDND